MAEHLESLSEPTLTLTGVLQVETALNALNATGANPPAENVLRTILDVRQQIEANAPETLVPERPLLVQFGDNTGRIMKADIITGLEMLQSNDRTPEQKLAAQALLEVMIKSEKP